MKKSYLSRIKIENLGQHNETDIFLGKKLTVIASANGVGKSTFVNALNEQMADYINFKILEIEDAEIKLTNNNSSSNKIIFDKTQGKFIYKKNNEGSYKPIFKIFNEQNFIKLADLHQKSNFLSTLNMEFNMMKKAKIYLIEAKKLISINDKYFSLKKPPKNIYDAIVEHEYKSRIDWNYSDAKKIVIEDSVNKIFLHYKKYKENSSIKELNKLTRFERAVLRNYFWFLKDGKLRNIYDKVTNFIEIKHDILSDKSILSIEIDSNAKRHLESIFVWNRYVSQQNLIEKFDEIENYLEKSEIDRDNYIIEFLENNLKKHEDLFERAKNKNLEIALKLKKIIKLSSLSEKIKINNDLSIKNKKGSNVLLSTGELRILNLLMFLEDDEKNNEIIVLDDPLSSVDSEYTAFFIDYLKSFILKRNQQIILLTHSNFVLSNIFRVFGDKIKDTKNENDIFIIKWFLNNDFFVKSVGVKNYEPAIYSVFKNLCNNENDSDYRLHCARRLFESLSMIFYGTNDYNGMVKSVANELPKIKILGKEFLFSKFTFRLINSSSHENFEDRENSLNLEIIKKQAIKEVIDFFEKIGYKPYKTNSSKSAIFIES